MQVNYLFYSFICLHFFEVVNVDFSRMNFSPQLNRVMYFFMKDVYSILFINNISSYLK